MKRYPTVFLVMIVLVAVFVPSVAQEGSSELDNIAIARQVIDEVWNQPAAFSPLFEIYTPTIMFHGFRDLETGGTRSATASSSDLRDIVALSHLAFPDLVYSIDTITAQDDLVTVQYTARGTFDRLCYHYVCGRGQGLLSSEEPVEWQGVFIYRFENGRIVEEWRYFDWSWLDIVTAGEMR